MKKLLLVIVAILSFAFISCVSAADLKVKTLEASMDGTKITATGTTDENMLAVSVIVYDEAGTTFIKMESGQVDNGKYNVTIDGFEAGKKYTVRVANYDGGDFLEQKVPDGTKTPDTGDNIIAYIVLGSLSVISLIGIVLYRKKLN